VLCTIEGGCFCRNRYGHMPLSSLEGVTAKSRNKNLVGLVSDLGGKNE
jgi:hypothetical protein